MLNAASVIVEAKTVQNRNTTISQNHWEREFLTLILGDLMKEHGNWKLQRGRRR